MALTRRNVTRMTGFGVASGLLPRLASAQGSKEIKLGLMLPITGNQAQYGDDMRRGAELAVEQLNAAKVAGATLTLHAEDSKGDPQEAANVAQKFVSEGDITAVIGDFSSTACLAAAPIYQRAGMIMLTPVASHPDITKSGSYIFRDTPIAASECRAVTSWAKELGYKKVAVIGRNDDYGRAYGQIFRQQAEADGATVVGEEYIAGDTQDLKPLITGMRAKQPQAVFLALFQVETALLFRQSKEMNFNPIFMSGAGLFNPQLLTLGRSAANGLLLVSTFFPESDRPEVKAFVADFKAKYNVVPSKFSAHTYDSVGMVVNAIKAAASTDRAKVRAALAATKDYKGVTGDISFDRDREVTYPLLRLTVQNEKFTLWKA